MNKVIVIGRTTTDIEVKMTQNQTQVATFTLAVPRRSKEDGTDFLNVVAWKALAETASRYVHKGDRVAITGRIQTRNFDGKDGKKVYITEIIADDIEFLESKKTAPQEEPAETDDLPF